MNLQNEHNCVIITINVTTMTSQNYPKFCLLTKDVENPECNNMTMSFPLKFYGEGHDWTCDLLSESSVAETSATLVDSLNTNIGILQNGIHFDKGTIDRGYPLMVRSYVQFGAPMDGFESEDDELNDQNKKYEELIQVRVRMCVRVSMCVRESVREYIYVCAKYRGLTFLRPNKHNTAVGNHH